MSNFRWISSDSGTAGQAYITIDKQERLYLSAGARNILNLPPPDRKNGAPFHLIVGYDKDNRRIVVAKPELIREPNVKPFKFNRDSYAFARAFIKDSGIPFNGERLRFEYVGKEYGAYPVGSHAFEIVVEEPKEPR